MKKAHKAIEQEKNRSEVFKANDLSELAGLSYRQLNDWEERAGFSATQRTSRAGWRRFAADEVFVLMVCAEIRQQFGVPLDSLYRVFSSKAHARFKFASSGALAGDEVWLATDLQKLFAVSLNGNFNWMLKRCKSGIILLRLTPLLKRLLKHQEAVQNKSFRRRKLRP